MLFSRQHIQRLSQHNCWRFSFSYDSLVLMYVKKLPYIYYIYMNYYWAGNNKLRECLWCSKWWNGKDKVSMWKTYMTCWWLSNTSTFFTLKSLVMIYYLRNRCHSNSHYSWHMFKFSNPTETNFKECYSNRLKITLSK